MLFEVLVMVRAHFGGAARGAGADAWFWGAW